MPLADLETLAQLVRDATVVGLGASSRGARELNTLMHRVLRFLVEDVGFRSLAVEDDWTTGLQINEYVRTGDGDPRALVADAWVPFRTEEFLDVILWMRSYNERHPADPVRFVGVDINRVRSLAYDAVADHVRQAAPDRLDELEAHYATLRPAAGIDDRCAPPRAASGTAVTTATSATRRPVDRRRRRAAALAQYHAPPLIVPSRPPSACRASWSGDPDSARMRSRIPRWCQHHLGGVCVDTAAVHGSGETRNVAYAGMQS